MQIKKENAFFIEYLRAKLAIQKDYKKLKKLYSKHYPEIEDYNTPKLWDKLNKREPLNRKKDPMGYDRLKAVQSLIKGIKGKKIKILNVGCGSGDLEELILKKFKSEQLDWFGIDISPATIQSLKRRFPNANFKKANIEQIKLKNNNFDYVIALEVLEHIRPSKIFLSLQNIKRALKKKGNLIVSVPLNEGLEKMVKRNYNPNAHVRVYTPELIKAELEMSGFKVLREKTLFAFSKHYIIKTIIAKYIFLDIRRPNDIIIIAQKP